MSGLGLDMDDKDDVSFLFWSYSKLKDALRPVKATAKDYVHCLSMTFIFSNVVSQCNMWQNQVFN